MLEKDHRAIGTVEPFEDGRYIVSSFSDPEESYLVDLKDSYCGCKDFEFRGWPCKHALHVWEYLKERRRKSANKQQS